MELLQKAFRKFGCLFAGIDADDFFPMPQLRSKSRRSRGAQWYAFHRRAPVAGTGSRRKTRSSRSRVCGSSRKPSRSIFAAEAGLVRLTVARTWSPTPRAAKPIVPPADVPSPATECGVDGIIQLKLLPPRSSNRICPTGRSPAISTNSLLLADDRRPSNQRAWWSGAIESVVQRLPAYLWIVYPMEVLPEVPSSARRSDRRDSGVGRSDSATRASPVTVD